MSVVFSTQMDYIPIEEHEVTEVIEDTLNECSLIDMNTILFKR